MIRLLFLIGSLITFQGINLENDMIVKNTIEYYDPKTPQLISIIEYSITNTSDKDCYTWIDFKAVNTSEDIYKALKYYFYSRHGDFSLSDLLTETLVFSEPFRPVLGESFIKLIPPKHTFRYLVYNEGNTSIDIEKNIFIVKENVFNHFVGGVINTEVLFPSDCIMLKK